MSSLYLTIGKATSQTCTVRVTARTVKPVIFNNFTVAFQQEMTIEGFLYADGPVALSNAMLALERAASEPNVSVGLSHDAGQTRHWLSTNGAIGGVVLTSFDFMDTPLHMATEVKYRMTVAATYGNTKLTRNLVVLDETLSYTGEGGPDVVLAPQAGELSVYQTVSDFTDVKVTQSGRVLSRVAPNLPPPLFNDQSRDKKTTRDTMSYIPQGLDILMYQREYQYNFQFPSMPVPVWPTRLI